MSAGTDASILGYGKVIPNSNINSNFVNSTNSNYSAGLGSNEIPYNCLRVDAANSNVSLYKGGRSKYAKTLKRKIKNIVKVYKNKMASKRKLRTLKRRLKTLKKSSRHSRALNVAKTRSRTIARSISGGCGCGCGYKGVCKCKKCKCKKILGGQQYLSNVPFSTSYGFAGNPLPPNLSALANPTIFTPINNYN